MQLLHHPDFLIISNITISPSLSQFNFSGPSRRARILRVLCSKPTHQSTREAEDTDWGLSRLCHIKQVIQQRLVSMECEHVKFIKHKENGFTLLVTCQHKARGNVIKLRKIKNTLGFTNHNWSCCSWSNSSLSDVRHVLIFSEHLNCLANPELKWKEGLGLNALLKTFSVVWQWGLMRCVQIHCVQTTDTTYHPSHLILTTGLPALCPSL